MFPTGKAQQVILDILGEKAGNSARADEIFASYGFAVASKRVGRSSVPVVKPLNARVQRGFERDDDFASTAEKTLTAEQNAALAQYREN